MRCICLILSLLLVSVYADNVVYTEPELLLDFSSEIHPYAWAHRLPTPFYTEQHTPYSDASKFDSFVELQTHVPAQSHHAKRLTHAPSLLEASSLATSTASAQSSSQVTMKNKEEFIGGLVKGLFGGGDKPNNNPADIKPIKLEGSPSPFVTADNQDVGTGFGNSYRRAVYGLRRRRMPFTGDMSMQSLNPFRRANSVFNTPADMMFPNQRIMTALNPVMTDFGRFGAIGAPAYGGYSSFGAHQLRRNTAEGNTFGAPVVPGAVPSFPNVGAAGDSFMPYMNNRWDGEKFTSNVHPFAAGPSPFVAGSGYKFFDFYGGGAAAAGGAAAGAAGAPPAGGAPAAAPSEQAPAA